MRTAIVSDIHANLEALTKVLYDIELLSVDRIVCLGDVVGYGPNPNECIELAKRKFNFTLKGNHDAAAVNYDDSQNFNINARIAIEWTSAKLREDNVNFLKNLSMSKSDKKATYVHATPYEPEMWYYISSIEEAEFNFRYFDTKFCFVGHTHVPITVARNLNGDVSISRESVMHFDPFTDDKQYLINVGSVGQPRDKDPRACYGILDTDASSFTFRRVDYNIRRYQEKMRRFDLPDFLIERIAEGK